MKTSVQYTKIEPLSLAAVSGSARQRTLNVKKTSALELAEKWGDPTLIPLLWHRVELYIRCNAKGEVKWETSLVYRASELFNRKIAVHG